MKLNGEEKFKFTTEQENFMKEENELFTGSTGGATHSRQVQFNIRMQQGEHTGQPLFSNLTSVEGGQGIVIVDFGFLDPQTINAFNQMARSGEKTPNTIDAKLSCRIAISIDAANHLAQQLNQLLGRKVDLQGQANQQDANPPVMEAAPSSDASDAKDTAESRQSGFRFPWSKKTH